MQKHCYIERKNNSVVEERLFADRLIKKIYSENREKSSYILNQATKKWVTDLLGFIKYDIPLPAFRINKIIKELNVNLNECIDSPSAFKTVRDIFERKIDFKNFRYMDNDYRAIVSPCDAKVLIGSLSETSIFYIKNKFFCFEELLQNKNYEKIFNGGDFAIFRLTPDEYHYNHMPVSGILEDIYQIDGPYHSCNPHVVKVIATPYSKNKRVITIINTDIENGSKIGKVAMIEIAAMMIGEIAQCYSEENYDNPVVPVKGVFLKKGQPKSLYRPGSSTTILLFENDKIDFCKDLITNSKRADIPSRYSLNLKDVKVETRVEVRSTIAYRRG